MPVSLLSMLQRATCMSIALKRDADRAVAEIMVVASACIIHKLIRGSLPRLCVRDVGWSGATCNMRDPACFVNRMMVTERGLLVPGARVVPPHRGHWMPFAPKARIPRALNQERKTRNVKCSCLGTCKNVDKPNASLSCTYEYAKHVSKSVLVIYFRTKLDAEGISDIDIMSHFVMMENREGIASSGGFSAMGVEDCLAGCIGTQLVPELYTLGILFSGSATFSRKGILKWDI